MIDRMIAHRVRGYWVSMKVSAPTDPNGDTSVSEYALYVEAVDEYVAMMWGQARAIERGFKVQRFTGCQECPNH